MRAAGCADSCARCREAVPELVADAWRSPPAQQHKIVKKRLKPFLRNQSDMKLAMGVRARGARRSPPKPRVLPGSGAPACGAACCAPEQLRTRQRSTLHCGGPGAAVWSLL